jgi:hypothetical protein
MCETVGSFSPAGIQRVDEKEEKRRGKIRRKETLTIRQLLAD